MIFPIAPSYQPGLVVGVLIGFAFGFVLERAGLGRADKLAAQFYGHDLTVMKVIFSAIVTATLGLAIGSALGIVDLEALAEGAATGTFLVPMIVGGILFGAGFVLSGYCPGTSLVAVASGKIDGLLAAAGVVIGQLIWAELEHRPGFASFHGAGARGNVYLWELLPLPATTGRYLVAAAVTAAAIGCFVLAEKLERVLAARGPAGALAAGETRRSP